jgi:hypothetical protein
MADSIQTHSEHAKLEAEVHHLRRLTQSSRYTGLATEDKSRLDTQLKECEEKAARKKEELAEHIARFMESDTWPVVNQPGSATGTDTLKIVEIVKSVAEWRDTVTTLNDSVGVIVGVKNANTESEADFAMDVDDNGKPDNGPLAKRRRTSRGPGESSDGQFRVAAEAIQQDIANLRDMLAILEGRLSDLENDGTQQHRELMDEIEARIDSKLDTGNPSAEESAARQQASEKLNEVEQNLIATGAQVDEIAVEVASLITRTSSIDTEVGRLKHELRQLTAENTLVGSLVHCIW